MSEIPGHPALDRTIPFLWQGYQFLPRRARRRSGLVLSGVRPVGAAQNR